MKKFDAIFAAILAGAFLVMHVHAADETKKEKKSLIAINAAGETKKEKKSLGLPLMPIKCTTIKKKAA